MVSKETHNKQRYRIAFSARCFGRYVKTMNMNLNTVALVLFVFSSAAWAEVSDKIILPNMMAAYAVILSTTAILLLKKWPKWFLLISTITIALSSGGLITVLDEHVGPTAIIEQGTSYKYFAYAEISVVILANVIGLIWGLKSRRFAHA